MVLLSYQIPYVPVLLMRGSYRSVTVPWAICAGIITILLSIRLIRMNKPELPHFSAWQTAVLVFSAGYIIYLCVFISMHQPAYGSDTDTYISIMNEMYYNDRIWIRDGFLDSHRGLNSLFGLLTLPSLILKIRPYYVSLFMIRILLVLLTGIATYRFGKAFFRDEAFSFKALGVILICFFFLMNWNSQYQAHFFFRRSNEAKAYCHLVLFPFAGSIYLQMCDKNRADRRFLWLQQILTGSTAIAVSMSTLTTYPFLALIGMAAVLLYDKFKAVLGTLMYSFIAVLPNLIVAVMYFMIKRGYFVM